MNRSRSRTRNGQLSVVSCQLTEAQMGMVIKHAMGTDFDAWVPAVCRVERGTAKLRETTPVTLRLEHGVWQGRERITSDFGISVRSHAHGRNRRTP